jgi:cytochrome P450
VPLLQRRLADGPVYSRCLANYSPLCSSLHGILLSLSSYTRRLRTAFADLPPEKILIPPDFRSKPSPILGLTARTNLLIVPARHAGINAGAALDVVEELKRFTVDVTTLITFGHDVNTVEQGDDVIQRKLELVLPAFNRRLFALFPTWRLVRLPRDRCLDRALAELRAWLGELVVAERARLAAEPGRAEQPSNFLEAMLSARDDDGRPFSDDVIFGNLMTMLVAGEDTTAYQLGWAVHQLCDSPESVMELRREADELLGTSDVAGDIETANKLFWAGAVANETMRLRPVTPVSVILEAKVETVVGDLLVPKGTRVFVLTRPAACDPDHFVEPQAFRPRRWLGETAGAHDVSAHTPFGSGPRLCPGRVLAVLEMKLLLSMLYRNFNVERVGGAEGVREVFAFTMLPVGLKVHLRRRSSAQADTGTA